MTHDDIQYILPSGEILTGEGGLFLNLIDSYESAMNEARYEGCLPTAQIPVLDALGVLLDYFHANPGELA